MTESGSDRYEELRSRINQVEEEFGRRANILLDEALITEIALRIPRKIFQRVALQLQPSRVPKTLTVQRFQLALLPSREYYLLSVKPKI
jgi:hypothetical protein